MDGTAHHRKNKGYEVPKKEAEELKRFGVNMPKDRIIENMEINLKEVELLQIFLLFDG
jgi:hypothetical protein